MMKVRSWVAVALVSATLLVSASLVRADDPPESPDPRAGTARSDKLSSGWNVPEVSAIQPDSAIFDVASAGVVYLQAGRWPEPTSSGSVVLPLHIPGPGCPAGGQIVPYHLERSDRAPSSAAVNLTVSPADGESIVAASASLVMSQGFESGFPSAGTGWTRGGSPTWGAVSCYALGGSQAAWPAAAGTGAVSPCSGANYPANLDAWMIYGPFSLVGARSATLDFFFRIESEGGSHPDRLSWMASTDGAHFYGYAVSGSWTSGPFINGYNFFSFDLRQVPTLGDVTGQPNVWIAFKFGSDSDSTTGQGPFVDELRLVKNTDPTVLLTDQNFDVEQFPNPLWESFDNNGTDNGDYSWDDVMCNARSDGWSMWPANGGADALDPCAGQLYPNDAQSWLLHGPFNLTGASRAWVDFYFRNHSELVYDKLAWAASVDGSHFYGYAISGTQDGGPFGNGYNLMRMDLSSVYQLGDVRGRSQVWLAFVFKSDSSVTDAGPFLDDVRIVVERQSSRLLMPLLVLGRPEVPVLRTRLYVQNSTDGLVTNYIVYNTPEGDIACRNIPEDQTVLCGEFTPGTYRVRVTTTECGSSSGEVYFPAGDVTRVVRCVR